MNVVSLFDRSGIAVEPWAEAGYTCYCYDLETDPDRVNHKNIHYVVGDVRDKVEEILELNPVFISAFPPCTDLAVSGAAWFKRKKKENPLFQEEAMSLVYQCRDIGDSCETTYYIENPVSVISTKWRKPDYTFDPCDFSALAPEDNYTKKTCLWTSKSFKMPEEMTEPSLGGPDKNYIHYLGSRQRGVTGSKTPKGFSRAVFLANRESIRE